MSLTNMRDDPGSSIMSIGRAGSPATSGRIANSSKPTTTTPSVAWMGSGNGSSVTWEQAVATGMSAIMPAR
jgi:hypothetical protein